MVVSLEALVVLGPFDAPGTVDAFTSVAWLTAADETGGRDAWLERLLDFARTVAGLETGDAAGVADDGAVVPVAGAEAGGALSARARAAPNAASVARTESHRSARIMRRSNPELACIDLLLIPRSAA
jgi:hypothetical protein